MYVATECDAVRIDGVNIDIYDYPTLSSMDAKPPVGIIIKLYMKLVLKISPMYLQVNIHYAKGSDLLTTSLLLQTVAARVLLHC